MVSIGSVSVDVVPDARGFDRDLAAQLNPQAVRAGREYGRNFTDGLRAQLAGSNSPDISLGVDTGKASAEVDGFIAETDAKLAVASNDAGQRSGDRLAQGMRNGFMGGSPLIAAAIVGGLTAGAPAVAAAAGVLFGGIAAVAVHSNEELKAVTAQAGDQIKATFTSAAQVTVPMFEQAITRVRDALVGMGPQFQSAFTALRAPIDSLTTGLIQMVQNALGPLVHLMQSAGPIFQGMSVMLAEIGTGLGKMFDLIAQHGTAGGQVFASLGAIIQQLLPIVGQLVSVGVELAAQVLPAVASTLGLVANVLDKIAPVLPGIVVGFLAFKAVTALEGPLGSLSARLQTIAAASEGMALKLSGGAASAVSSLSGALPVLGVALGAAGFAFEHETGTVNTWAKALLDGGTALEQVQQKQQAMAAIGGGTSAALQRYGNAWDSIVAHLKGYNGVADEAAQKSKQIYDAMSPLQQRQQDVTKATNDLQAVLADPKHTAAAAAYASDVLGSKQSALALFQAQVAAATNGTSVAMELNNQRLQGLSNAASAANTQIGLLKGSLDALTGKTVTMDEAEVAVTNATIAATTALQGKSGALVDATGKLNLNTEAGAAAFTSLKNLAGADNTLISTMEQQGATSDQVKAKDAELRDSFIRTAEKMGFSADEAHHLADQILGIPSERNVQINTNAAAAGVAIHSVQDQIDNLHGRNVTITVLAQSAAGPAAYAVPGSGLGGFAYGGFVSGPGGPRDDAIPAMLSNGEFVANADATKRYRQLLEWINAGHSLRNFPGDLVPQFANGGPVNEYIDVNTAPFNQGIQDLANKVRDSMSGFVGALNFAQAQVGKPYIWGGVGPDGYDCSGFMSAITNVIRGENPYSRVGTTYTFPWPGFGDGIGGSYSIGSSDVHMAGTLLGHAVESTGDHVRVDGDAHGAGDGQFWMHGHLPAYELGTNYVPQDGLRYLHRGEAVVPAEKNHQGSPWQDANVTVVAQFGEETIEARAVRVVDGRLGDLATNWSRR